MESRKAFIYGGSLILFGFLLWLIILEVGLKGASNRNLNKNKDLEMKSRLDLLESKLQSALSQLDSQDKRHSMMERITGKIESDLSGITSKIEKIKESSHQLEVRLITLEHKVEPILNNLENFGNGLTKKMEKFEEWNLDTRKMVGGIQTNLSYLAGNWTLSESKYATNILKFDAHLLKLEETMESAWDRLDIHDNRSSVSFNNFNSLNSTFESRQKEMHEEMGALESDFFEAVSYFNSTSDKFQDRLSLLETQLESESTKLVEFEGRLTAAIGLLNLLKETVPTDIRFTAVETHAIWRDVGFYDEYGYVVTRVSNFNRDAYVDTIGRRRIQKRVNGNWVNI